MPTDSLSGMGSRCPVTGGIRSPMHIRPKTMLLALVLVSALAGTGCKNVEPWQRRTLSDNTMRGDRDPAGQGLSEHMWFSREAASGGRGVGGGGCGCN